MMSNVYGSETSAANNVTAPRFLGTSCQPARLQVMELTETRGAGGRIQLDPWPGQHRPRPKGQVPARGIFTELRCGGACGAGGARGATGAAGAEVGGHGGAGNGPGDSRALPRRAQQGCLATDRGG